MAERDYRKSAGMPAAPAKGPEPLVWQTAEPKKPEKGRQGVVWTPEPAKPSSPTLPPAPADRAEGQPPDGGPAGPLSGSAPGSSAASEKGSEAFRRRTGELFRYLITTFQSMLPADKAEQFGLIAEELGAAVEDNCRACGMSQTRENVSPRDPRRNRFLLRLVVGRVSHHFAGERATMPRSLIEGIDSYLKKAFGPIIYEELNSEADQILYNLSIDDDRLMLAQIRKSPQMRRFVDMIFIRVLFRFENFANGKKTFISILDHTMQDLSNASFGEEHFYLIFEDMFSHLWHELQAEESRLRWDFLFGDGTSKRIEAILAQGLARWLKRQDGSAALATQLGAATAREEAYKAAKKLSDAPRPTKRG